MLNQIIKDYFQTTGDDITKTRTIKDAELLTTSYDKSLYIDFFLVGKHNMLAMTLEIDSKMNVIELHHNGAVSLS